MEHCSQGSLRLGELVGIHTLLSLESPETWLGTEQKMLQKHLPSE